MESSFSASDVSAVRGTCKKLQETLVRILNKVIFQAFSLKSARPPANVRKLVYHDQGWQREM